MPTLLLFLVALLGAPLFAVIAASALWGFHSSELDLMIVPIEVLRLSEMPVLVAIPLFTFAGYLLGESKAPQRLVRVTDALFGWMPGGLAVVAIFASSLFTAFTGASGVTIVALGALLLPALLQGGYSQRFSLGLVTTSGSLGLLFAPSLPLILYAVVAQQQSLSEPVGVDQLFLAGIVPGLLMLLVLAAYSAIHDVRSERRTKAFSWREAGAALWDAALEIPLPFLVLGGIYSGWFVVSDAAAITAAYVLLVEVVIRREVSLRKLISVIHESMTLVGAIMIILGASLASTNYMIDAEVPAMVFDFMKSQVDSAAGFMFWLLLFLLILGMILDIFSALVIVVPMVLPVAIEFGVHPVHLGIVFLAAMQLGYLTPPVGMNLFIASFRFNQPILTLVRATVPFFLLLLVAVVVIAYFPQLSLWLGS